MLLSTSLTWCESLSLPASVGEAMLSLFVCVMNSRGGITQFPPLSRWWLLSADLPLHLSCHEDDDLIISCALIAIVMKMMILLSAVLPLELSWRVNLWCNPLMSGDQADFDQCQYWSREWPFLIIYKTKIFSMMVSIEKMRMKMTSFAFIIELDNYDDLDV